MRLKGSEKKEERGRVEATVAGNFLDSHCIVFTHRMRIQDEPTAGHGHHTRGEIGLVEAQGYPDKVTLRWHVPLSNSDGSLLADTSGLKVYRTAQKVGEECEL